MKTKRTLAWAALLLLALVVASPVQLAQTIVSSIRGRVTDPQGAVISGATVTVREIATNLTRTARTDDTGHYLAATLPSGTYELKVDSAGFATEQRSNVGLFVAQELTLDFSLTVATAQQSMTVSTEQAAVETQHTVGVNITGKEVDDLPTFNRSFADLAVLTPGITQNAALGSMGFAGGGQNQYQNAVFVDGGMNAMQFYGTMADTFPQDWVQEFQVMTNNTSAEFGHASGAFLNVITKSGTNDFHGRVYGFFQDAALNSNPYAGHFTSGQPVFLTGTPPYSQYRIGAYLGGRIIKNKLFFFAGFEDLSNTATSTLAITQYWINQGTQYIIPTSYTVRPFIAKADWNVNNANRVSFRVDSTNQTLHNCSGQIGQGCSNQATWVLESRGLYTGPIWSAIANVTSTFGGRAFNEFKAYYGVNEVSIYSNLTHTTTGQWLGGAALLADTKDLGLFSEKTFPGAHFGSGSLGGLEGETNMYFDDNFSIISGRHQFKFGGEISRPNMVMNIDASQHGRWNFNQDLAFNINNPASYPYQYLVTVGVPNIQEAHYDGSLYAQDTWRVRDNLTLNLGVRWDMDNSLTTGDQYVDGWNKAFIARYGYGGPVENKVAPDRREVAPRVGFVWAPTASRRTTFRAGAGIFYDQMHFNYADSNMNQNLLGTGRYLFNALVPSENPFYNAANPSGSITQLETYLAQTFPNSPNLAAGALLPEAVTSIPSPNFRDPFTEQVTAGFTQELGSGLHVQADFVSSHGRNMIMQDQTNVVLKNGAFVTDDPRVNQILMNLNAGWSQYTAVQTRVTYTRGSKLHLGVSYALARCTTNDQGTGVGGGLATNPLDFSIDVGPCPSDRRHALNADAMYTLPFSIELSGLFHYGSALPWTASSNLISAPSLVRYEPFDDRRGADYKEMDVRLSKTVKFRERWSATVMWEVFNLFNNENFYGYASTIQSSAFGQPSNMLPPRQMQGGFKVDF